MILNLRTLKPVRYFLKRYQMLKALILHGLLTTKHVFMFYRILLPCLATRFGDIPSALIHQQTY